MLIRLKWLTRAIANSRGTTTRRTISRFAGAATVSTSVLGLVRLVTVVHPVSLERVAVQLDAEPRPRRQGDLTVVHHKVVEQKFAAERRLGQLDRQGLDVGAGVA